MRWRRWLLFGGLVLAGAVYVAVAYRGGSSGGTERQINDPASDPRCVYANTIFGWVFRASEDSRSAPLLTAAREGSASAAPAEWTTVDAFEHHAQIWTAIAEGTAGLTPPKGFESRHESLTASLRAVAVAATAAHRTAASGDTDEALTILRRAQEATQKDAERTRAASMRTTLSLAGCFPWNR